MVDLAFYALALVAVLCAAGVVLARNPIASVLSLLGCFFCMAMIYLVSGYQFVAAIQILVYGGAVMVLFLFVVMLLNLGTPEEMASGEPLFHAGPRVTAALGIAIGAGAVLLMAIVRSPEVLVNRAGFALPEAGHDPVHAVAAAMFSRYSLAFEAASVLLLATAVGVMVLAKRERAARTQTAPTAVAREEAA